MVRYYCSGFDNNDAFGHGLGEMFKKELKDTKSIVYIPAGAKKVEKSKDKYIPLFTEHFKRVGIEFDQVNLITPDLTCEQAKHMVRNASFIMLMGGDPYDEKDMCAKLGILSDLNEYDGVMLGYSAGAMLMSQYIIITPCSEKYPDFHVEEGLNLDGISIYPHNNTGESEYPDTLVVEDETYKKDDIVKVADEYGDYYLLQDYFRSDGLMDVSIIKSSNGDLEFYTENDGKIWKATKDGINLCRQNELIDGVKKM